MKLDYSISRRQMGLQMLATAAAFVATPALAQMKGDGASPQLDVHFVPTPMEVVDKMLEMAELKKGEFLIDLGSGDGRIPIRAVKAHGARALGVDLDPRRLKEAAENARKEGVEDQVTFRMQNLFETDLSKADVISMYLLSSINMKLRPKLLELRPGVRIVSHAFNMGDWQPEKHERVEGRNAYMWRVPARIEGRWVLEIGGNKVPVEFKQQYQNFTGTADQGGKATPIQGGLLTGSAIAFTLDVDGKPRKFQGEVNNGAMVGTGPDAGAWNAARSPS
jgi:SAM-dependent methyltransferase